MNGHPLQWSVCMLADSGLRVESRDAERPVLVVSREIANDALPIVTVLPLAKHTPGRQVYPNEVLLVAQSTELDWAAIAMAHQI